MIVVGTGLAGLWTAWRLAESGREALVVTKHGIGDSATAWAQGGIAAAVGPDDSPTLHAVDTLAAADGLADPRAVEILTREGPERIRQLIALGASFDRAPNGTLRFGLEAAHSRPRILHAGGDQTGAMLVRCLASIVASHERITILERCEVVRLLMTGKRVTGILARRADGSVAPLFGHAVVLATGGVGQLYAVTTNPLGATGDGWALAFEVGAELENLEFLQFHPTAVKLPGVNPAPLVSEAVRGAGAVLIDRSGRRFMTDVDPRAELAPRDIVARAVAGADANGGAWLDARMVPQFEQRFPGVTRLLAQHGLDPARDPIPVAPAQHYAMGGIGTDLDGRSSRAGLWAVGEVACTGVHGANRLASNSLLEALVFADRAARALVAEAPAPEASLSVDRSGAYGSEADRVAESIRAEMRGIMSLHVGVQRSEASLSSAEEALRRLVAAAPLEAWRTRHQLVVAGLIARAARRRRESRGGHARTDFPRRVPARRLVSSR